MMIMMMAMAMMAMMAMGSSHLLIAARVEDRAAETCFTFGVLQIFCSCHGRRGWINGPEFESDMEDRLESRLCLFAVTPTSALAEAGFGIGDGPVAKVLANFFTDPADLASLTAASCLSGTNLRQAQRVVRSWDKQIAGKGAGL